MRDNTPMVSPVLLQQEGAPAPPTREEHGRQEVNMTRGRVRSGSLAILLAVAAAVLSGCATAAPAATPTALSTIALPRKIPASSVTPEAAIPTSPPTTPSPAGPLPSVTPPAARCDSDCRDALSKVTLFPQDLPGPWKVFDHEPAFGFSTFPKLLGVGAEQASFTFYESYADRIVFGGTVFLSGSREMEAFDRVTAKPDRFLQGLFDALDVREVAPADAASSLQTEDGSSIVVSGTCLFRGNDERLAFDVALFREGFLGAAIFYVYPIGDDRDPDIVSVAGILGGKIAVAFDPNALAKLPAYFVETATPPTGPPAAGRQVSDPQCAFSFSIPVGWEALAMEDPLTGSPCAWGIRPSNWDSIVASSKYAMDEAAFWLAVVEMPLEDAALYGYFEFESGQWYVSGRQGILTPASVVQDRGLTILRGMGMVGLHDLQGSYVGLAELPRAVVSNGVRSAVLEAAPAEVEPAFELVLRTLRFLE